MFGDHARMANVETMTPCVLWELSALRLDEMMASKPALALELMRALGAVMAERMRMNLETGLPMT
jgi:CRP-like cAMP-binding protein